MYIEARTEEGYKITFSFNYEDVRVCQAYLLHEGSEGEQGKIGGAGGFGGRNGFSGDIEIPNHEYARVTKICHNVHEDRNLDGNHGQSGKPGKKGVDRGYTDSTLYFWSTFPKLFSSNEDTKLTLHFQPNHSSDRVWCFMHSRYCAITSATQTIRKSHKLQMNHSSKMEQSQREVQVQRKKSISKKNMKETYNIQAAVLNGTHNLVGMLEEKLMDLEQKINTEQSVATSFKVARKVTFTPRSQCSKGLTIIKEHTQRDSNEKLTVDTEKAMCVLQNKPTTMKSTQLFSESSDQSENEKIGISAKQQVLRMIHSVLETLPDMSKTTAVSFKIDTKVLSAKEHKDPATNIERFFVEDSSNSRAEIIQFCKNLVGNGKFTFELLQVFIEEYQTKSDSFRNTVGNEHARTVRLLYKQLRSFETKKTKVIALLFFTLNELLENEESIKEDLFETIIQESNSCKVKFENKLKNHKLLSAVLKQIVEENNIKFDFSKILSNELLRTILLEAFNTCLEKIGPFSSCYREFLSNHFQTNILFYQQHQDCIELVDNHNPRALQKIHILLTGEKFSLLNVDSKFEKLIQHHKSVGTFYDSILVDVDYIDEIKDLEDYKSKQPFLSSDYMNGLNTLKVKTETIKVKISHKLQQDEDIKTIVSSLGSEEDKLLMNSRLEKLKTEFIGYAAILHHMATRFRVEGNKISARELSYIINSFLESALDDFEASKLMTWIVASHHQLDWLIEIAMIRIELFFKQTLSSNLKSRWRNYLISQQGEIEKLLFLLESVCHDSNLTISLECFEEILDLFSRTPNAHVGLEGIAMERWRFHLKEKWFEIKIKSITTWSNDQMKEITFFITTLENRLGPNICEKTLDVFSKKASKISCDEEKAMIIETLKLLTSCDISFCKKVLEKLSSCKISDWKVVTKNVCLNKGQERSYGDLIELMRSSENTSQSILKQIQDITKFVNNLENLTEIENQHLGKETSSGSTNDFVKVPRGFFGMLKDVTHIVKNSKSVTEILPELWKNGVAHAKLKQIIGNLVEISLKTKDGPIKEVDLQTEIVETIVKFIETNNNEYDNLLKYLAAHELDSVIFVPFIAKVIESKMKQRLRNTQIISIVTMLKNTNNTLAQVSTGEGKSLIVVVLSIIKALLKNKVNVITSSTVLAKRDAEAYKEVFKYCGIDVGHNCSEDLEERKKVYSSCQVVYGELGNFQRDYLLDRIYNKNIRGDCAFDVVIVDEVDSMLLDKGNNVLYLAHDIPGLDKLESIFIHIWKWLNDPKKKDSIDPLTNLALLKESIVFDIFGLVKKECIEDFEEISCKQVVTATWNHLIKQEVVDLKGKVLVENMAEFESKIISSFPQNCLPRHHLNYIFNQVFSREKSLNIPNYLKPFVEKHLDNWIQSGVNALMMQSERDYVVDVDRSETASERNPNIILLDPSTGTDLVNSQWDEGLHQFLQLKHGCKLSLVSLKAVFISNVSYLKLYNTLYGLTGTLGSQQEREMLQETYKKENTKLDFVTISTAKFKNFSENLPILCSHEDWGRRISEEACKIVNTRSVLIICESVIDVIRLKECFSPDYPVHTYTRDYEELTVAKDLQPGQIIIATNLAGRGTDITISKSLEVAGGLHVCLTYLPSNCRIEEQAYGRVARNGQPGTAQMILRVSNQFLATGISKFIDLKNQRDQAEVQRLAEIQDHYKTQILPEEYWLERFKKLYKKLMTDPMSKFFESTMLAPSPASCEVLSMKASPVDSILKVLTDPFKSNEEEKDSVKSVLVETCLNEWAFWLDKNSSLFGSNENKEELESRFQQLSSTCEALCSKDFDGCLNLMKDPYQLIKLGLLYLGKRNSLSIQLFDEVIKKEPVLSEMALYYKVSAKTMDKDLKASDIISDLETVANAFFSKIHLAAMASYFIDWMKENNPQSILQIDSFKQQQINISNIYNVFLQSVNDLLGHEVSPECFNLKLDDNNKYSLMLFNELVSKGVLSKPIIKSNIEGKDLKFAWKYMMSPQKMLQLLNPLKGKTFSESEVQEVFKSILPSKELFWDEMKQNKCFDNEEELIFICMQDLESLDSSIRDKLSDLNCKNTLSAELHNMYLYECDSKLEEHKVKVFEKKKLLDLIGQEKVDFLVCRKAALIDKRARFCSSIDKITFSNFDSIGQNDLVNIGIHSKVANEILIELKSMKVIKPCNNQRFSLATHSENIENLFLPKHKPYNQDVKSVMEFCFAFRIAYEKVQLLSKHFDCFSLPLQASLHKHLILDLDKSHLITKTSVVEDIDLIKMLSNMYPSSMSKEEYIKLFSDQFGHTSSQVVDALVQNEWLIIKWLNIFNRKYSINSAILTVENQMLDGAFQNESKTIAGLLLNHHQLRKLFCENKFAVTKTLEKLKGTIYTVDTPKLSLKPLLDVLKRTNLPVTELPRFSLNGYDKLFALEEKEWTWRMILNTFVVFAFSLAQILVGIALGITPIGAYAFAEGVSDLAFVGTSMFTGHCTWRGYIQHKLVSALFTSWSVVSKISTSTIKKLNRHLISSVSFQEIKRYIVEAVSQTKEVVRIAWSTACGTRAIKVADTIKVHTMKTIERRVASATIHSQLDLFGDFVTETIYSIIDAIIENHDASNKIVQIHQIFDARDLKICNKESFKTCLKTHQNNLEPTFKNLTELLITTIDKTTNSKEELKRGRSINNDLLNIMSETKYAIQQCFKTNSYQFTIVVNVMDDMEHRFHNSIEEKSARNHNFSTPSKEESNMFKDKLIAKWKKEIKKLFSDKLQVKVISPVLTCMANVLLAKSSQNSILMQRSQPADGSNKPDNLQCYYFAIAENALPHSHRIDLNQSCAFDSQNYNNSLLKLFKRGHSACIFSEILRNCFEVDSYFLKIFCSLTPLALRKEGINVPDFLLVVEKNGMEQKFSNGNIEDETPKVVIVSQTHQNPSMKNNIPIMDVFEALHHQLLESTDAQILRLSVIKAIENDEHFQTYLNSNAKKETTVREFNTINWASEQIHPYQNFHIDGKWKFNSRVDVDLRNDGNCAVTGKIPDYILNGFKTALGKINFETEKYLKQQFCLQLEDFFQSNCQLAPQKEKTSTSHCSIYPSKYELVVPLPVSEAEGIKFEKFLCSMVLENCSNIRRPYHPLGPHIKYQVEPEDIKLLGIGVRGYILLPFICKKVSIKDCVENCHVAGELILSNPQLVVPKLKKKPSKSYYNWAVRATQHFSKQLNHALSPVNSNTSERSYIESID